MRYPFLSLAFDESGALSSSKSQQISGLVRNIKHETAQKAVRDPVTYLDLEQFYLSKIGGNGD